MPVATVMETICSQFRLATDDIDAVVFDRAIRIGAGGLAGLVVAGLAAFTLGRGLVRPLGVPYAEL